MAPIHHLRSFHINLLFFFHSPFFFSPDSLISTHKLTFHSEVGSNITEVDRKNFSHNPKKPRWKKKKCHTLFSAKYAFKRFDFWAQNLTVQLSKQIHKNKIPYLHMQSKNVELEYLIYSHNWMFKQLQFLILFFAYSLLQSVLIVYFFTWIMCPQYLISKQLVF